MVATIILKNLQNPKSLQKHKERGSFAFEKFRQKKEEGFLGWNYFVLPSSLPNHAGSSGFMTTSG